METFELHLNTKHSVAPPLTGMVTGQTVLEDYRDPSGFK